MRKMALSLAALALVVAAAPPAGAATADHRQEFSAQSRPRITIHPRYRGLRPDAKRHCRAWLAQEYRVSGTVVVPRRECWWQ